MASRGLILLTFSLSLLLLSCSSTQAQLSANFYSSTCPNALSTIRSGIRTAVQRERRMAASLIRLHFHDCFVQGCDASVLLDDTSSFTGEKTARNNRNSVRGFNVIDAVKSQLETLCPGVVSCADVVAVAARDASAAVGGPSWAVTLGRRDSTSATLAAAEANLPSFNDGLDSFATTRRRQCPSAAGDGNDNLAPLDLVTPNSFDNNYFRNLVQRRGLLQSDQVLFSGGSTDGIVNEYSRNGRVFSSDFAAAMVRMGSIEPLTGSQGQVRRVCSVVN
ncbi:unnamed protein product [Linum tenue]|uniref:peroxidase n=1 Tax=Linum tenue TaxID=586396 RepID=A0AAV0IVT3_9ROSI|nr:unnamed protein product [Linum tenue]